jgi:hypothetical protein
MPSLAATARLIDYLALDAARRTAPAASLRPLTTHR